MTNALANGTRASYFLGFLDNNFFDKDTTVFTVDHEVKIWISYPGGDGKHDSAYAVEQPACAGPFHLDSLPYGCMQSDGYDLVVDGCPLPRS